MRKGTRKYDFTGIPTWLLKKQVVAMAELRKGYKNDGCSDCPICMVTRECYQCPWSVITGSSCSFSKNYSHISFVRVSPHSYPGLAKTRVVEITQWLRIMRRELKARNYESSLTDEHRSCVSYQ